MSDLQLYPLDTWNLLHDYDDIRMFDVDEYLSSFDINLSFDTIQRYVENYWYIFEQNITEDSCELLNGLPQQFHEFLLLLLRDKDDILYILSFIFLEDIYFIQIHLFMRNYSL